MKLDSSAFRHEKDIPSIYTCDGRDISPPLFWNELPVTTKSLVLIMEDPDAPDPKRPKMIWDHWLLYNIPPALVGLPEAVEIAEFDQSVLPAKNSWDRIGYCGPCSPIGKHRYFHKLYALDIMLPDLKSPDKAGLMEAMRGHVLARAELVGTYQKKREP